MMNSEKFTGPASGVYHYYLNDAPAGVEETWRIWSENDLIYTTSQRVAAAFGTTITVNTISAPPWPALRFHRITAHIQQPTPATAEVRAVYEFADDGSLRVSRIINGTPADGAALTVPADCIVAPLMRVFLGPTILAVAARAEAGAEVLVPDLMHLTDPQQVLQPTFDARRAEFAGYEELPVNGCQYETARYAYLGRHYDDQAQFWLDARGLLVRYTFRPVAGQLWRIDLGPAETMNEE